jgi:hypothetical protein
MILKIINKTLFIIFPCVNILTYSSFNTRFINPIAWMTRRKQLIYARSVIVAITNRVISTHARSSVRTIASGRWLTCIYTRHINSGVALRETTIYAGSTNTTIASWDSYSDAGWIGAVGAIASRVSSHYTRFLFFLYVLTFITWFYNPTYAGTGIAIVAKRDNSVYAGSCIITSGTIASWKICIPRKSRGTISILNAGLNINGVNCITTGWGETITNTLPYIVFIT